VREHPPACVWLAGPGGFASLGLIDPKHLHYRQRRRKERPDVGDERVVDGGPPDPVVLGSLGHAPVLVSDRVAELGP